MGEPYYNTTADHAYVPKPKKRKTRKPKKDRKVKRGTSR
jgi:hypothetical protein